MENLETINYLWEAAIDTTGSQVTPEIAHHHP